MPSSVDLQNRWQAPQRPLGCSGVSRTPLSAAPPRLDADFDPHLSLPVWVITSGTLAANIIGRSFPFPEAMCILGFNLPCGVPASGQRSERSPIFSPYNAPDPFVSAEQVPWYTGTCDTCVRYEFNLEETKALPKYTLVLAIILGPYYNPLMLASLRACCARSEKQHPGAEEPLLTWYHGTEERVPCMGALSMDVLRSIP